jgi:hypothetical protein
VEILIEEGFFHWVWVRDNKTITSVSEKEMEETTKSDDLQVDLSTTTDNPDASNPPPRKPGTRKNKTARQSKRKKSTFKTTPPNTTRSILPIPPWATGCILRMHQPVTHEILTLKTSQMLDMINAKDSPHAPAMISAQRTYVEELLLFLNTCDHVIPRNFLCDLLGQLLGFKMLEECTTT